MYFCHIKNFPYGEINERSFSNPHLWIDVATGIKIYATSFENKNIRKNMIFQVDTTKRFFFQSVGFYSEGFVDSSFDFIWHLLLLVANGKWLTNP